MKVRTLLVALCTCELPACFSPSYCQLRTVKVRTLLVALCTCELPPCFSPSCALLQSASVPVTTAQALLAIDFLDLIPSCYRAQIRLSPCLLAALARNVEHVFPDYPQSSCGGDIGLLNDWFRLSCSWCDRTRRTKDQARESIPPPQL